MALLYDPGIFMPATHAHFSATSWMMGWSDGVWCLHDLEPGGTVYLVDVAHQQIVWHTRVTASFAVPYEAVGSLAHEVSRRWGLTVDTGDLPPSGYCVGWRAEPIARLDREPIQELDHETGIRLNNNARFRLDGFQFTTDLPEGFLRHWGIEDDTSPWCSGRPRLGWFAR